MIFRVDILKQNSYHGHMFPREMLYIELIQ